jgi:CotH kinase protein/Lamin Tail Domain/FlgD Ig-like domain
MISGLINNQIVKSNMSKNSITIFLVVVILSICNTPLIAQDFYDINTINMIDITFEQPNWDSILAGFYQAGNGERLLATAVINGEEYDSIGVKYKGNSSYNSVQGPKKPFNIKLDYIIDNQDVDGYGTLKLSNGFKDPSFVRETIGYEIARKYTPASLANYINVYVNDVHIGLYTSVQSVDKDFLRSHFDESEGAFFKGDMTGGQGPGGGAATLEYRGDDSTSYYGSYEIQSDYGWEEMVHLCDTLNNYTDDIEEILDVDRALWQLAFHNVLLSLDSPINAPHNFYLYRTDNWQFNYIFWDLNMTFGTFNRTGLGPGSENLTIAELQVLSPLYNIDNPGFPILNKLLANQEYLRRYLSHMKTIIEENFSNGWYSTRSYEIQEIINDVVSADPNKLYSFDDFLINVENQAGTIPGIMQLMEARIDYLLGLDSFQNAPVIDEITTSPEPALPNSEASMTVNVDNAEIVKLEYRYRAGDRFETAEMFDDGSHNDGAADDGIYGVSITSGSYDMQYYIYAENANSGTFSPVRAEYEFHTLNVSNEVSDIVINEFLASNDTTMADQDGEFDDWIELYNTSDESISMLGLFLSDDSSNTTKWAFPDTSIAANDYLIIWADNDEEQVGLHANFKLSASGESLLLVNQNGDIVDGIAFGEQENDVSNGRFPNGTGPFADMIPSFSEENLEEYLGLVEEDSDLPTEVTLHQNHPNPFNPSTTIRFDLVSSGNAKILIFNLLGERVTTLLNRQVSAGTHEVVWNGTDSNGAKVSSGVYICLLQSENHQLVNKMILMK